MTRRDIARLEKEPNTVKFHKIEQSVISAVDTTPWTLGETKEEEIVPVPMALAI